MAVSRNFAHGKNPNTYLGGLDELSHLDNVVSLALVATISLAEGELGEHTRGHALFLFELRDRSTSVELDRVLADPAVVEVVVLVQGTSLAHDLSTNLRVSGQGRGRSGSDEERGKSELHGGN